jgi:hypothetical protein
MKNLEERQREMKERALASSSSNEAIVALTPRKRREDQSDVITLKKRVAELEKRLLALQTENQKLRNQKTIIVERPVQQSTGDSVREQRHNFLKYSNVRRY